MYTCTFLDTYRKTCFTFTGVHMHMYIIHLYICTHTHTSIYTDTTNARIHVYMCSFIHVYIYAYVYIYTYTYTYTCVMFTYHKYVLQRNQAGFQQAGCRRTSGCRKISPGSFQRLRLGSEGRPRIFGQVGFDDVSHVLKTDSGR